MLSWHSFGPPDHIEILKIGRNLDGSTSSWCRPEEQKRNLERNSLPKIFSTQLIVSCDWVDSYAGRRFRVWNASLVGFSSQNVLGWRSDEQVGRIPDLQFRSLCRWKRSHWLIVVRLLDPIFSCPRTGIAWRLRHPSGSHQGVAQSPTGTEACDDHDTRFLRVPKQLSQLDLWRLVAQSWICEVWFWRQVRNQDSCCCLFACLCGHAAIPFQNNKRCQRASRFDFF